METIDKLRKIRLEKLQKIKKLGIDPYPAKSQKSQNISECLKLQGKKATTCGRITGLRAHGGSTFADLVDQSAKIQLFFSKDKLSTVNRELLTLLDIGDFIQVSGKIAKTQAGEITIFVDNFGLLTKSLRPIPSSFYGLKDIETRLRKRYLDLITDSQVRDLFIKKAAFWSSIRQFLVDHDFIEVETPALEPIAGGADATPFTTHHKALDTDFYLRISLELYQKRLLVGGFEKIFEIGKVFRNEGIDAQHLQDYLQMEFYWAYADYETLMDFLPQMYKFVVENTLGTTKSKFAGKVIDWAKPWPKIDYADSFKQETKIDILKDINRDQLFNLAQKIGASPAKNIGEGRLIDLIYKKVIRPKITQPSFLINHPISISPLAKRNRKNPKTVQRIQVLACGTEVGNGFSELNDPLDQEERFRQQQRLRKLGDQEAQMYDQEFVQALEYGMPPAAGFGLSQRLFAVLVDKPIRETVFFPTLRPDLPAGRQENNKDSMI